MSFITLNSNNFFPSSFGWDKLQLVFVMDEIVIPKVFTLDDVKLCLSVWVNYACTKVAIEEKLNMLDKRDDIITICSEKIASCYDKKADESLIEFLRNLLDAMWFTTKSVSNEDLFTFAKQLWKPLPDVKMSKLDGKQVLVGTIFLGDHPVCFFPVKVKAPAGYILLRTVPFNLFTYKQTLDASDVDDDVAGDVAGGGSGRVRERWEFLSENTFLVPIRVSTIEINPEDICSKNICATDMKYESGRCVFQVKGAEHEKKEDEYEVCRIPVYSSSQKLDKYRVVDQGAAVLKSMIGSPMYIRGDTKTIVAATCTINFLRERYRGEHTPLSVVLNQLAAKPTHFIPDVHILSQDKDGEYCENHGRILVSVPNADDAWIKNARKRLSLLTARQRLEATKRSLKYT